MSGTIQEELPEIDTHDGDAEVDTDGSSDPETSTPPLSGPPAQTAPAEELGASAGLSAEVSCFFREVRSYVRGVLSALLLNDDTTERVTADLDRDYQAWYARVFGREIQKEEAPAQIAA